MHKLNVSEENAPKFWNWLHTRGGLAIWNSINLSNPGTSWTTPVNNEKGEKYEKPTWQAGNTPGEIITDPAEVTVSFPKEVKRFRVGVRMSSQGLSLKVTDGGTRRIREAVAKMSEKFGKEAWYSFDYSTQEAIIWVDGRTVPLVEYAREKGWTNEATSDAA